MRKRHPHKENVLLVNITRLGDMLQATPTIAGMKMENPDCRVSVVVEKQFEGICKVIPNIDEVVSIDLGMTVRSLTRQGEGIIDAYEYVSDLVDDLKSRNFDYCLNMSSSAYTAMLLNLLDIGRNGGWTSDDEGYRVIESDWARLFASSVFHQNRQYNSLNLVDVFRCSADVERHPNQLLLEVPESDRREAQEILAQGRFTNTGPLIMVQAGASQGKRQWAPARFVKLIKLLVEQHNARVVLTGAPKEAAIVDPIEAGVGSNNVLNVVGNTSIPQLSALLHAADILVTGDTGPMHIAAAVGTPSVSMFLASAFGFETGPYSEENIVLQPVIGCGPCNPNKGCTRPDCHDHIDPELLANIVMLRLQGPIKELPQQWVDPSRVIAYRTCFDKYGYYDMQPVSSDRFDGMKPVRDAYRKLWIDDLGGFEISQTNGLGLHSRADALEGLEQVVECAQKGTQLIQQLIDYVRDESVGPQLLGQVNEQISELDRVVEQIGFHYAHLGPVTRMFVFAKENIQGTDALDLASQMAGVYADLERRCRKLSGYCH